LAQPRTLQDASTYRATTFPPAAGSRTSSRDAGADPVVEEARREDDAVLVRAPLVGIAGVPLSERRRVAVDPPPVAGLVLAGLEHADVDRRLLSEEVAHEVVLGLVADGRQRAALLLAVVLALHVRRRHGTRVEAGVGRRRRAHEAVGARRRRDADH